MGTTVTYTVLPAATLWSMVKNSEDLTRLEMVEFDPEHGKRPFSVDIRLSADLIISKTNGYALCRFVTRGNWQGYIVISNQPRHLAEPCIVTFTQVAKDLGAPASS